MTRVLKFSEAAGCVFLEGNLCSVYDARPGICQHYPHLVRGNGSIASRMWQFVDRASVCPIVYNCLELSRTNCGSEVGRAIAFRGLSPPVAVSERQTTKPDRLSYRRLDKMKPMASICGSTPRWRGRKAPTNTAPWAPP